MCATAGESAGPASRTRCTSVAGRPQQRPLAAPAVTAGLVAALTGLLAGTVAALLLTLWLAARWGRRGAAGRGADRGGLNQDTGQLYRPPPPAEHEQHSRYVKLQATTKL